MIPSGFCRRSQRQLVRLSKLQGTRGRPSTPRVFGSRVRLPRGKSLVQRKLRKLEEKEKAEQKKRSAEAFDYNGGSGE